VSYRPITDVWILARSKTKYYGAYPAGFLHRARALLGVSPNEPILHVCSGKVREYPFRGVGEFDKTLDIDASLNPDYVQDARKPFPTPMPWLRWAAVLIDRPYTEEDADKYACGRAVLPTANELVRNGIEAVRPGGKVGILDYLWPQPPKNAREVAVIAVGTGRNARARWFTVFERVS
jgi:hypothetical protein